MDRRTGIDKGEIARAAKTGNVIDVGTEVMCIGPLALSLSLSFSLYDLAGNRCSTV